MCHKQKCIYLLHYRLQKVSRINQNIHPDARKCHPWKGGEIGIDSNKTSNIKKKKRKEVNLVVQIKRVKCHPHIENTNRTKRFTLVRFEFHFISIVYPGCFEILSGCCCSTLITQNLMRQEGKQMFRWLFHIWQAIYKPKGMIKNADNNHINKTKKKREKKSETPQQRRKLLLAFVQLLI